MKKLKFIFFSIVIITLLFYPYVTKYNKLIFESIIFSLVPSIFPILILVNLSFELGCLDDIYSKIKNSSFGRFIYTLTLILICITLGMPSMQNIVENQREKGIISKKNKEIFINRIGSISFTFIYSISFINLPRPISIIIITLYLFLSIFSLLLSEFKIENIKIQQSSKAINLSNVFMNSLKTMSLIICGIILFSFPLFIIELIPNNIKLFFEGLIEFSYPCFLLSKKTNIYSYICLLFFYLFPSFSIVFQSKLINKQLNIKNYLKTRFITAVIGIILFLLLI